MNTLKEYKNKLFSITPAWFFTELPWYLKAASFYVRGDLLVLLPLLALLLLIGLFSFRFMFLMVGIYIVVRGLGEMMYWFLQQFSNQTFRPPDWGFKKLDNNAIYILYQTGAVATIMLGVAICAYILLYHY